MFTEIVKKIVEDKNYGVTKEDIDSVIYKKSIEQKLSQQEELAYSELTAHLAENLLGNEDFIKRLARSNRGLFNKIKNFISDKINGGKKSEAYRTAQHIFENALKEIKEKRIEEAEQFDNSSALSYNFKKWWITKMKEKKQTKKVKREFLEEGVPCIIIEEQGIIFPFPLTMEEANLCAPLPQKKNQNESTK